MSRFQSLCLCLCLCHTLSLSLSALLNRIARVSLYIPSFSRSVMGVTKACTYTTGSDCDGVCVYLYINALIKMLSSLILRQCFHYELVVRRGEPHIPLPLIFYYSIPPPRQGGREPHSMLGLLPHPAPTLWDYPPSRGITLSLVSLLFISLVYVRPYIIDFCDGGICYDP